MNFLTIVLSRDGACSSIPTSLAVEITKHILKQINTLPADMDKQQEECLSKGKELMNILLLGPSRDGNGCLTYYDIIVAVSIR